MNSVIIILIIVMSCLFVYHGLGFDVWMRERLLGTPDATTDLAYNYRQVKKTSPDRVVVTLSTSPENIHDVRATLNSILDQTERVDQIALNLPIELDYDIPYDYNSICNIFRVGKDYGVVTGLTPTLLREKSSDTIIILINDDKVYHKNFIETMVRASNTSRNCCIKTDGAVVLRPSFVVGKLCRDKCECIDEWLAKEIKDNTIIIEYSVKLNN